MCCTCAFLYLEVIALLNALVNGHVQSKLPTVKDFMTNCNIQYLIQYLYFVHNKSTTFFTHYNILYKGKEKVCEKQTSIKNRKK